MDNTNTKFLTDSFQLSSYLLCESCKLISLDRTNPRRIVFIFEESERRKKLTDEFLSYKTTAEPHRLFSAQKDLKQLIHQSE